MPADPSAWPSASKELLTATVRAQPGSVTLPGAPHLERFAALQVGAMQEAIRKGREQAAAWDAGKGVPAGAPPLGLNRQYRSMIEARIAWWQRAKIAPPGTYAKSTSHAAGATAEADWAQISADLQGLAGRLAAGLYTAFDEHLGGQALAVLDAWPHKMGLSRAMLQVEVAPGSGGELMRGSHVAGMGYSGYIKEAGFRVKKETYTTKKGEQKTRTKHVYDEDRKMPAWRAAFLVKQADGKWRFDVEKYEAAKKANTDFVIGDYKRAKGKPYRDLMLRPAAATVAAIGKDAVAAAVKEG